MLPLKFCGTALPPERQISHAWGSLLVLALIKCTPVWTVLLMLFRRSGRALSACNVELCHCKQHVHGKQSMAVWEQMSAMCVFFFLAVYTVIRHTPVNKQPDLCYSNADEVRRHGAMTKHMAWGWLSTTDGGLRHRWHTYWQTGKGWRSNTVCLSTTVATRCNAEKSVIQAKH